MGFLPGRARPLGGEGLPTGARAGLLVGALALLALGLPALTSWTRAHVRRSLDARLDAISARAPSGACLATGIALAGRDRLAAALASWQTVGGCGASSATGAGAGIKWIGRNVSGGLFGVQCQATYSPLLTEPAKAEHHFTLSTLISKELSDRWAMGVNVPFVYKYLRDPYELDIDLSNGGVGDVSVQLTSRLGAIAATAVTASLILPTGKFDTTYKMKPLRQHNQLGFGRYGASLMIDHNMDESWGLVVIGASGTYRGGENTMSNYRAPAGSVYSYAGYYLGRFVPSLGISATGFTGHDRDQSEDENSALYLISANASIEWSTDWMALIVGGSLPYQYDGVYKMAGGQPKSPWGFGQWTVGMGLAFSPF
jgi:hypothetical protein